MPNLEGSGSITQATAKKAMLVEGPFNRMISIEVDASQIASGESILFYIEGYGNEVTPCITYGGTIRARDLTLDPDPTLRPARLRVWHWASNSGSKTYNLEVS